MTPKEKAEELLTKMNNCGDYGFLLEHAKECAIIAVDELIIQSKDANFGGFGLYWQSVRTELEKL